MHPSDIVFYGASAFLVGVLTASAGWNFLLVFIVAAAIGAALFIFKKIPALPISISLILFFSGAFYYHLYLNLREARENIHFAEEIAFSGVVTTEPKFTEKTQFFDIKLEAPYAGKVKVVTSQVPERHYGDLIMFQGKIEKPERKIDPPVSVFPKVSFIEAHQGFLLKENLINFKSVFINQFRKLLPQESAALMSGITFGYQSDFSKDFKNKMARSGTTHLVALSGYNITILVLAIAALFRSFLSRRLTFYLTVLAIILFAVMVGGEASVVRAAIMGFLTLLAREAGRIYSFRNAVVLAAAVMALFDPTILVFNIGFQLSFLSLVGIVYLEPALKKFFDIRDTGSPTSFGWRENALTTLSAQLAVAPLLISYFEKISLISLFANVLILEFVPLTMALGFLLGAVSFLFFPLGALLGWFVNILLAYEVRIINFFANLEIPIGSTIYPGFVFVIYYLALIGFMIYFNKPKRSL